MLRLLTSPFVNRESSNDAAPDSSPRIDSGSLSGKHTSEENETRTREDPGVTSNIVKKGDEHKDRDSHHVSDSSAGTASSSESDLQIEADAKIARQGPSSFINQAAARENYLFSTDISRIAVERNAWTSTNVPIYPSASQPVLPPIIMPDSTHNFDSSPRFDSTAISKIPEGTSPVTHRGRSYSLPIRRRTLGETSTSVYEGARTGLPIYAATSIESGQAGPSASLTGHQNTLFPSQPDVIDENRMRRLRELSLRVWQSNVLRSPPYNLSSVEDTPYVSNLPPGFVPAPISPTFGLGSPRVTFAPSPAIERSRRQFSDSNVPVTIYNTPQWDDSGIPGLTADWNNMDLNPTNRHRYSFGHFPRNPYMSSGMGMYGATPMYPGQDMLPQGNARRRSLSKVRNQKPNEVIEVKRGTLGQTGVSLEGDTVTFIIYGHEFDITTDDIEGLSFKRSHAAGGGPSGAFLCLNDLMKNSLAPLSSNLPETEIASIKLLAKEFLSCFTYDALWRIEVNPHLPQSVHNILRGTRTVAKWPAVANRFRRLRFPYIRFEWNIETTFQNFSEGLWDTTPSETKPLTVRTSWRAWAKQGGGLVAHGVIIDELKKGNPSDFVIINRLFKVEEVFIEELMSPEPYPLTFPASSMMNSMHVVITSRSLLRRFRNGRKTLGFLIALSGFITAFKPLVDLWSKTAGWVLAGIGMTSAMTVLVSLFLEWVVGYMERAGRKIVQNYDKA